MDWILHQAVLTPVKFTQEGFSGFLRVPEETTRKTIHKD